MNVSPWVFKANQRFLRIQPCEINKKFLEKLFKILKGIQNKALGLELARIDKMRKSAPKRFSKKDCEKLKKQVRESYKINVEITSKREFFASDSTTVFNDLSADIIRIKFDNNAFYKSKFNMEPMSTFIIN